MRWVILGLLVGCGGDDLVDTDPVETDTDTGDTDTYVPPPPDLEIELPPTFDFTHIVGPTYCPQFIGTMVFTNHTTEAGTFESSCETLDPGGFMPFEFARQQTTDYVPSLQLEIPAETALTVNVVFNCNPLTTFENTFTVRASAGDVDYEEVFTVFADIPAGAGGG